MTSLSRRRLLRWTSSMRSRVVRRYRVAGEQVVDGAEDQRQRRPEFMGDVGEKRRLRAIDLGERFGAPALFFVRARVRERRAELAGDELEKRAVLVVERTLGVQADHQPIRARVGAGSKHRQLLDEIRRRLGAPGLGAGRAALQLVARVRQREDDVLRCAREASPSPARTPLRVVRARRLPRRQVAAAAPCAARRPPGRSSR